MENGEIARIFHEIADLLEIKGEDRFRIRSYRNAADTIEAMAESLRVLYEAGEKGLEHIPGVGKGIREKIIEMLTTGACAFHDGLLKELPPGIFDILKVSGVGPKKAMLLYQELGISDLDALEQAAKTHKLHTLPGIGEKTEQNLLKAIRDLRVVSASFSQNTGHAYAESIIARLKRAPGVSGVEAAGSLRRWKDTIHDIDIICITDRPEDAMHSFVTHPDVKEVVAHGETKSSVRLRNGMQADLRVLDEVSYGSGLLYFTGSKAHNVALREMAKHKGLKINEYGVFKEPGDVRVAGATEEEVYRSIGLPWIPPELRENRGEIEAALKGALPRLVELGDIKGDLHSHTTESDGASSLEAMADAAMERGYAYLNVTDHSKAVGIAHGLDDKRLLAQIKAIDAFNERLRKAGNEFRLLKGAEVDIRADGTLDHPDELLAKLDCVVAAIHSGFNMTKDAMTSRIIKGLEGGRVNILAHPTGRLIGVREPYALDMEAVMNAAAAGGVSLELNSYPERLDLSDAHCRMAKEKGILVAISTDAHATTHMGNIVYGVMGARRGWLGKDDVLNTRGLADLLKLLRGQGKIGH
ncbi:MAG: DNA polymerase/3'-5' exonuclease PolX [Deltaproteobacteria bacterium]|nr:DNA polymerase/3'-5' exonuclease PolX [Deltaproteobacteria bacterium]